MTVKNCRTSSNASAIRVAFQVATHRLNRDAEQMYKATEKTLNARAKVKNKKEKTKKVKSQKSKRKKNCKKILHFANCIYVQPALASSSLNELDFSFPSLVFLFISLSLSLVFANVAF